MKGIPTELQRRIYTSTHPARLLLAAPNPLYRIVAHEAHRPFRAALASPVRRSRVPGAPHQDHRAFRPGNSPTSRRASCRRSSRRAGTIDHHREQSPRRIHHRHRGSSKASPTLHAGDDPTTRVIARLYRQCPKTRQGLHARDEAGEDLTCWWCSDAQRETVGELIAAARASRGIRHASSGKGSAQHWWARFSRRWLRS